jgi:biotin-dependent carboxylase-like uncharacterized protein
MPFAGCSSAAVVERHVAGTYRVFMLGFLPGFPYMAPVDASIAALRRATPRIRVPAGSVGIAGRQTGIYPRESPGGWQIIGRTAVELFDQDRDPPALMAPGDVVRFTPVQSDRGAKLPPSRAQRASTSLAEAFGGGGTRFAPQENGASITIVQPGLLTTIQDRGRWGYQNLGVPVSGAMDLFAHRLANALVDNPADAATLEVTVLGPELRFEQSTRIAVTGASLSPTVNGAPVRMDTAFKCGAGDVLRFGARQTGARAYVAVDGGIAVTAVLGSRATHLRSGMGGVDGRVLRAGDRLSIGSSVRGANPVGSRGEPDGGVPAAHARWGAVARPTAYRIPAGGARLRVLPGPQARFFDASVFTLLERTRFAVSPHSDRMGYRLTGTPIPIRLAGEMISEATFVGALQVPPSGEPILLMADRQTTGGYPQLAVVITADLPLAAQLAPGDWVEFEMCSRPDAVAALKEQERRLRALD